MSNYLKWLSYSGPASKDTITSSTGRRWNQWNSVDSVRMVNYNVVIPPFSFIPLAQDVESQLYSYIAGQFNYSASGPFTFTKNIPVNLYLIQPVALTYFFCVRFTKNGVSTRYSFGNPVGDIHSRNTTGYFTPYNGEIILPNFVIEVWTVSYEFIPLPLNVVSATGFSIQTSLLQNPLLVVGGTLGPAGNNIMPVATVTSDLNIELPFHIPLTVPAAGPYLIPAN